MANNEARISVLENQVTDMKKDIDETKNEVKWITKHIYIAMGGLAVVIFFIELYFNHPRG